jgi:hypothetical protein
MKATLAGLLYLLAAAPAWAGAEQSSICARDEVVNHVAAEIRSRAPYATILRKSIGERPSGNPAVVLCAVAVVERDHDTAAYRTRSWIGTHEYSVRWLHPGFEVTMRQPVPPAPP